MSAFQCLNRGRETYLITVKTLNVGTPRQTTIVVLNIKQFDFTLQ